MKKNLLLLPFIFLAFSMNAKVNFIDSRTIGNLDYNALEFIRSVSLNEITMAGTTSRATDVSLNTASPLILNANQAQDVFWMDAASDLQSTHTADFMNGTQNEFIMDMTVIRQGNATALFGANCSGGVLNVTNVTPVTFSVPGAIAFSTGLNSQVVDFILMQASIACGLAQAKTVHTDWLLSGSYAGVLNQGGSNYTSTGTRDGFIGTWNPASGNPNWFGEIKAFGYNSFDRVFFNENTNEILATGQLNAGGIYTVNGVSTTLNASPFGNSVFLMRLNASTGAYINHTILGATSNVNPFGLLETNNGVYFAGNMNGDVYPDQTDFSKVQYNRGLTDQLVLKFDAALVYQSGKVFGSSEADFGKSFRKFNNSMSGTMAIAGAYTLMPSTVIDQQASVLIIDESLNLIDSIIFGGTGYDQANDVDLDTLGFMYVVGTFQDTADMDPGPATYNVISAGGFDGFVSRFDATTLGYQGADLINRKLVLFPTPATDRCILSTGLSKVENGIVEIINIQGKLLSSMNFNLGAGNNLELNTSELYDGVYFVRLHTLTLDLSGKLIVSH